MGSKPSYLTCGNKCRDGFQTHHPSHVGVNVEMGFKPISTSSFIWENYNSNFPIFTQISIK
jgi:hypothetical protein